jgi:hypothetical protein
VERERVDGLRARPRKRFDATTMSEQALTSRAEPACQPAVTARLRVVWSGDM